MTLRREIRSSPFVSYPYSSLGYALALIVVLKKKSKSMSKSKMGARASAGYLETEGKLAPCIRAWF
jgi:hypothetical protein